MFKPVEQITRVPLPFTSERSFRALGVGVFLKTTGGKTKLAAQQKKH